MDAEDDERRSDPAEQPTVGWTFPGEQPQPPPEPATEEMREGSLRGVHIAWARIVQAAEPEVAAAQAPPTEPAVTERPEAQPAPRLEPTVPAIAPAGAVAPAEIRQSPLGHLAAVIVTLGLAWAMGCAILAWLIVLLLK